MGGKKSRLNLASKHEYIVEKIILSWSLNKTGRVYKMKQGLAVPLNGNNPIWFGPLTRKFKGFSDLFGFEFMTYQKYENWQYKEIKVPVFCAIEVKTKAYSKLSRGQIDFLNYIKISGGRAYVAMEDNSPEGYSLTEWVSC